MTVATLISSLDESDDVEVKEVDFQTAQLASDGRMNGSSSSSSNSGGGGGETESNRIYEMAPRSFGSMDAKKNSIA